MTIEIVYIVLRIMGDYALCMSNKGEATIALALLPSDIDEGDRILFKDFEYTKL